MPFRLKYLAMTALLALFTAVVSAQTAPVKRDLT